MMSRFLSHMLPVVGALALLVGCSDDGEGPKDASPDTTFVPDTAPAACGVGIYPCAPYGVNADDVAANLSFLGYSDPKDLCKADKDKVMDTATTRRISFQGWHLGDPDAACSAYKKELLWVMVSAGWCSPCQQEVAATQAEYVKGAVDPRVGILNVVFETDRLGEPITDAFLKKWISTFKLTMPVAMDPEFKMGAYFDKKATPFNMLVDTKTMKIYFRQTGGSLSTIGQKVAAFFN